MMITPNPKDVDIQMRSLTQIDAIFQNEYQLNIHFALTTKR
jgi:hypothetical protein